jgi:hypothetical protein
MEPEHVAAALITGLGCIAWYMIRTWKETWETRVLAHDDRLDIHAIKHSEQDVVNATIKTHMEHIKVVGDQTASDVKELLNANGKRASG